MPHSYYIVHLEEKDDVIFAQLRRFAYAGAFTSSVWDEFDLKEYGLHPTVIRQFTNRFNPNDRRIEVKPLRLAEIICSGNKGDYQYITQRCKEIFLERNQNIENARIQ